MHRLFVALRPPPAIRTLLLDAMGGVPGARWQDHDQLHLTLRYIGAAETPQAEDIAAALHQVSQPRPIVAVSGVGTFDRKGAAHTLWAGVAPDEALKLLRDRINRVLTLAGVAPEDRAFKPHITLARLPRSAGPLDGFLSRAAGLSAPPFTPDAFLLYESTLGSEGSIYEAVARYPLT